MRYVAFALLRGKIDCHTNAHRGSPNTAAITTRLTTGNILQTSDMVYLKSIVAGLIAVIGTLVVAVIGFIVWGLWMSQRHPNGAGLSAVSYDIRALVIPLVIIVGLIFASGFWWQFRRAKRAERTST